MSACVSEMFVSWKIFLVLAACHIIICFIIVLFQRTEEHEFERGMKLEAVNPHNPNQICAATITKIVDHLMWVHLDSSTRIVASHVEHIASHNLFPVGWCESNGYQLRPPRKTGIRPGMGSPCKRVAVVQPEYVVFIYLFFKSLIVNRELIFS